MKHAFIFLLTIACSGAWAQSHRQPGASEIRLKMKKLNFLGAVLYVAAHPDDENTRAISYFVSDQLAAAAYLSMTRGDGGQNLIGPEIRDQLGLIRTQELLAARRIDGGQQFFTRANDFGFSKNAAETFDIWNKEEVLSDVVRVYRQFQPDVIITRFPPDARAGHGHHTASAMLAQAAFDLSADPKAYPDQLGTLGLWQPKRLFTNTGRWWNQTVTESTPGVVTINVGSYNPLLGKSYSEIAAESRTQHKSQGFGSPGRRGDAPEYLEFEKGEKAMKNIFEGVNTTWSRLAGATQIPTLVDQAVAAFNADDPSASVPQLLKIRSAIQALSPSVWKTRKEREVNTLIQDCLGLYVETLGTDFSTSPGEKVKTMVEVINRSAVPVTLTAVKSVNLAFDSTCQSTLNNNVPLTFRSEGRVSEQASYSDPYWLRAPHSRGLFTVSDPALIGRPENDPAITFEFVFTVLGQPLVIRTPLIYKWTDPVKGELMRPFEIVPPVFVNLDKAVYLFPDAAPRAVSVLVKSAKNNCSGKVMLNVPAGWKTEPADAAFSIARKGEEQRVNFTVLPAGGETNAAIEAVAVMDGQRYDHSLLTIQYDHIPMQTLLPKASARAVRLELKKAGSLIGYVAGAGDEIPSSLRNMGYEVWEMQDDEVTIANLKKADAVVLGVRALNTNERIRHFMPTLLDYVKGGGNLVVQYNTSNGLAIDADKFSPFPLTLSRDRVTEEGSAVRILKPESSLLSFPNKIVAADFDGWVQERGLYFPSSWGPEFEAPLSMNDTGEPAHDGSVLLAHYGAGVYIYTSLSFFRELPEGVAGAYKLFANIVSAGKQDKLAKTKIKTHAK